jgi:hypothetical protein
MTARERQEFKYEFESVYKKEKDREEDRLRRKALGLLDLKQQSFSKTYERIGAILTRGGGVAAGGGRVPAKLVGGALHRIFQLNQMIK